MATVYIKDSHTAELVERLARRRGLTKTEAVRRAVEADLATDAPKQTAIEKLEAFYLAHPRGEPSGLKADKAFYDWLSGEED